MALLRTLLVLVCAALALAAAAPATAADQVKRPKVTWMQAETNYRPANRRPQQIRYVVVHVTEGSFWGSIEWLQNPESKGSSHYVIARGGAIAQLVREKDIAWHAGNRRINELSIGIEHTGITGDPAGFTRRQYHASARLAAYHARKSVMPITRRHFIGHDEVPHPFEPGARGGADRHTDPGPYWDWNRYLRLVRHYAYPPKPVRLRVQSTTIYGGQTLAGRVPWRATTSGPGITRVDFLVNGKVRWRDSRAPYEFAAGRGLNTTALRNGRHVLELRAYGRKGVSTRKRLVVRVRNAPFVLTSAGVRPGSQVQGVVRIRAAVRKAPAESVTLFVDGRRVAVDRRAPYAFAWDARKERPGRHVLLLRAIAKDGRVSSQRIPVVVVAPAPPAPPQPPPTPPPAPEVPAPVLLGHSVEDGATVQGTVEWRPRMTGRVVRVEFVVDGALRHAATKAPFAHQWDTTREAQGAHVLTLRLIGPTGRVTEGSVTVTVVPPPAT